MKTLQIISEFPEGKTPSCKNCIFGYNTIHDNEDNTHDSGCSLIHNSYIKGILKGEDPDYDGNHTLVLCNKYDFSKPIVKFINEYDKK